MSAPQQLGRLALRVEGDMWCAYYAMPDKMERAVALAQIAMALVEREDRKQEFMALMQNCVADIVEECIGQRPSWPDAPQPAPEHEREQPELKGG